MCSFSADKLSLESLSESCKLTSETLVWLSVDCVPEIKVLKKWLIFTKKIIVEYISIFSENSAKIEGFDDISILRFFVRVFRQPKIGCS